MGNTASTTVAEEVVEESATPAEQVGGIKLYQFIRGTTAGSWELVSENAYPNFYDVNEDSATEPAKWYLEIDAGEIETEVNNSFEFEEKTRRITFLANGKIWAMKFPNVRGYHQFSQEYQDKLFENTFKVESDDKNKEKTFGKDVAPLFGKETDESREQWVEDMDVDEKPDKEEYKDKVGFQKEKINNVKMGAGRNSYLVRENAIEVMRNVRGGVEETNTTFTLTPQKGTPFTPSKILLAKAERQMNMLTPGKRSAVFQTDIETGKVVHEWTFQKDGVEIPMLDIMNDTKAAQLEERDTFLGLDKNRICRWDMRTAGGVASQLNSPIVSYVGGKDYSGKPRFACMATSGDGYVVVGAEDGTIRLYSDKSLARASSAIPGLGSPITAVDVTYDGKWVVATTTNYLMVVKTTFKDKKTGKDTNGFKSRMGANSPAPRLLRLKTEDAGVVGEAPLEKGKFTWVTEEGRHERWVVASCGNYTVLWNFRQVKLTAPDVVSFGGLTTCTTYHLIPKSEHVVDSVFMHDNYSVSSPAMTESAMVVVTDNFVYSLGGDDDSE